MPNSKTLSHTTWNCKYHVVFTPKYRRQTLYRELRRHLGCDYWGWLGLGNLRANGHPNGGLWRQFHCTSCEGYFLESDGTIFRGKQAAVELIVRVLTCLAEGLGIRATARVFEVEPNTVLHWLVEAAGLTDHVWSLKEVLLYRVPPWPQPQVRYGLARHMIV